MITHENLVRHELIGLEVTVSESANKSQQGLHGKVIGETRQILKILTDKGLEKSLAKDQCVFMFCLPTGICVRVDGKVLVARPEDRIKKKHKEW